MRYAARRDESEDDIVRALEQMGFHVARVSAPGFPDLCLSRAGRWFLVECKTDKGRLTKAQTLFHAAARAPIPILCTVDQAVAWARGIA